MQLNGSPVRLSVGSTNRMKVAAVKEVVSSYAVLSEAEITSMDVASGVSDQPTSLEETVLGAKIRAEQAYLGCGYGVGIESGLMELTGTEGDYANVCICSVYDGERHHVGISCGVRLPRAVTRSILTEGLNLNQAMLQYDLTVNHKLGSAEGTIGLLTGGRITRRDHCKQALITALVSVEQSASFAHP